MARHLGFALLGCLGAFCFATVCPLPKSEDATEFITCLEKAQSIDELVQLLPKNKIGKPVCDLVTFLKSSGSPAGRDIQPRRSTLDIFFKDKLKFSEEELAPGVITYQDPISGKQFSFPRLEPHEAGDLNEAEKKKLEAALLVPTNYVSPMAQVRIAQEQKKLSAAFLKNLDKLDSIKDVDALEEFFLDTLNWDLSAGENSKIFTDPKTGISIKIHTTSDEKRMLLAPEVWNKVRAAIQSKSSFICESCLEKKEKEKAANRAEIMKLAGRLLSGEIADTSALFNLLSKSRDWTVKEKEETKVLIFQNDTDPILIGLTLPRNKVVRPFDKTTREGIAHALLKKGSYWGPQVLDRFRGPALEKLNQAAKEKGYLDMPSMAAFLESVKLHFYTSPHKESNTTEYFVRRGGGGIILPSAEDESYRVSSEEREKIISAIFSGNAYVSPEAERRLKKFRDEQHALLAQKLPSAHPANYRELIDLLSQFDWEHHQMDGVLQLNPSDEGLRIELPFADKLPAQEIPKKQIAELKQSLAKGKSLQVYLGEPGVPLSRISEFITDTPLDHVLRNKYGWEDESTESLHEHKDPFTGLVVRWSEADMKNYRLDPGIQKEAVAALEKGESYVSEKAKERLNVMAGKYTQKMEKMLPYLRKEVSDKPLDIYYDILCSNGEIFLRMSTNPKGSNWRALEFAVSAGKRFIPLRAAVDKNGKMHVAVNPAIGGHSHPSIPGSTCSDCHGDHFLINWENYGKWKDAIGANKDLLEFDYDPYETFLAQFLKRTEGRFRPVHEKLATIKGTALPPYSDARHSDRIGGDYRKVMGRGKAEREEFGPRIMDFRPNTLLTKYAARVNGRTLANQFLESPKMRDLKFTLWLHLVPECTSQWSNQRQRNLLYEEALLYQKHILPALQTLSNIKPAKSSAPEGIQFYLDSEIRKWVIGQFIPHFDMELLTYSIGEHEMKDRPVYLRHYLLADLADGMLSDTPQLAGVNLNRKQVVQLHEKFPKTLPAHKSKAVTREEFFDDDYQGSYDTPLNEKERQGLNLETMKSLEALGGYMPFETIQKVCEIALRESPKELEKLVASAKPNKPNVPPPSGKRTH